MFEKSEEETDKGLIILSNKTKTKNYNKFNIYSWNNKFEFNIYS